MTKIPKIIYYTWVSDKPLPEKYLPLIEGWKELMPDYEIIPITLDNCPRNEWVDEAIKQGKYVLAGHWGRVQRLYETGGIYFDIDIEAVKRMDDFLNKDFVIGMMDKDYLNNAVMVSVPGHQYLNDQMDYMASFDVNHPEVENETGPRMVTAIARKYGWTSDVDPSILHHTTINNVEIYAPRFFYPYHYTEKYTKECLTPETYTVHHWASTWV